MTKTEEVRLREKILMMKEQGLMAYQIAKKLKMSESTVRKIMNTANSRTEQPS